MASVRLTGVNALIAGVLFLAFLIALLIIMINVFLFLIPLIIAVFIIIWVLSRLSGGRKRKGKFVMEYVKIKK